ncbi:MAG: type II secretion system protein GspL [Halioglobus sp.]
MQNTAIVRLINDRLAWYPPGASDEPVWLDDDAAAQSLRVALAQRKMKVIFAVPGADARLLTLPVTAAEKKHLAKSLPFMLEEQVAADVDDLHFAYTTIDADHIAVAVCARERVDYWQERLAQFPGITHWLPEPLLLPHQPDEWCLVLEQGSEGAEQTAVVRTGAAQGFTSEQSMLEPLLAAVLPAASAEADTPALPAAVVIYGNDQAADTALVPDALESKVQWRQGNLFSAMLLSEAGQLDLNLLQGGYAPRLPFERWWKYWRAAAALFALAFGLQLGADYLELRTLDEDNLALRQAVETSYRQAFPKGAVVDAEKQLSRQLDALRGTSESGGFVSLMEQVGGVVAAMPGTSIATINYNDKSAEMRMNLVATDFEAVEELRTKINAAGLEAVMESSNAQGDGVRARLRIGERS